jgi:hypothetical protein
MKRVEEQALVVGKLPRYDDRTAIAEVGDAAPFQETMRRDPVIPPGDAAAQGQVGFGDDLDASKFYRYGDAHPVLLLRIPNHSSGEGLEVLG